MVDFGQPVERAGVAQFGFHNPDCPALGLEVVPYAQLAGRTHASMLAKVHRTDFHQLFLVTHGTGSAMVDFEEVPCPADVALNVAPGRVVRHPRPSGAGDRVEALMVLFGPAFPPRLEHAEGLLDSFGPVRIQIPPAERLAVARCADELEHEYRRAVIPPGPNPATVELLRHQLGTLLLRLARLTASDGAAPGSDSVQRETFRRFSQQLERSFGTARNALDYAALLGYSVRTLDRACQSVAGQSTKAVIDARVTLEAKRLLAHTDLPVATIARRLGFSEPSNFGKFFTRATGTTPGAFRARERAG